MTALEVIATIFAIFVLVKIAIVLVNPRVWMENVAKPLLGNPPLARAVYAGLAVVIGYFVLTSLNIADVFAVMLFTAFLIGLGMLPYAEAMLKIAEEKSATRAELLRNAWLPIVIWVGIALWVLSTVFA